MPVATRAFAFRRTAAFRPSIECRRFRCIILRTRTGASNPMMKTFMFAFALTLLVTPVSAYTCEDVRAFVAANGLAQARAKARAAGMTDAQERQAAQCLGIRTGNVRRTGSVHRSKRH
jgi:hypothetical protein